MNSLPITLDTLNMCYAALTYDKRRGPPFTLSYYAAKVCAPELARIGILSTDWKIILVSLDLFDWITRCGKKVELPEQCERLFFSLNPFIRHKKLGDVCESTRVLDQSTWNRNVNDLS